MGSLSTSLASSEKENGLAKQRVLVVAAHPDDEVLGVGASLAVWARTGIEAGVLLLGEGVRSRGSSEADTPSAVAALRDAASRAASILDVELLGILRFPDNAFDSVPLLDIVWEVEAVVSEFRPNAIYTHHAGDLNIDHSLTCRAVLTATRPVERGVPDLYSFEVRSSTDWSDPLRTVAAFRPNVWQVLDASAVGAKHEALAAYSSEMRPWPHSRSHEAVDALLRHRGAQVHSDAAEAFELLRASRNAPS